jgi:hypothetical protein
MPGRSSRYRLLFGCALAFTLQKKRGTKGSYQNILLHDKSGLSAEHQHQKNPRKKLSRTADVWNYSSAALL